jgi:hypothetical protein
MPREVKVVRYLANSGLANVTGSGTIITNCRGCSDYQRTGCRIALHVFGIVVSENW